LLSSAFSTAFNIAVFPPAMIPTSFSAFTSSHWGVGSPQLSLYNGNSALEVLGDAADGYSTVDAMAEVNNLAAE
ncbi:hypothetical protein, partial [Psychromonas aquatilis]